MKLLSKVVKKKKILQDTLFYLLASLIPAFLLVLINPLLAKNLSPQDYAIIGYISSYASIITPVVTFMLMRYYFVNYFKVNEEERGVIKSSILQTLLIFSFLMSILVVGGISLYHFKFNTSSTIPLFPYLLLSVSVIWLGGLFTFQLSEYRIQRLSNKYFVFSISNGIVRILFLLLLVVALGLGALGYVLATTITSIIYFLVSLYIYRSYIFKKINYKVVFEAIIFCWPIALAGCFEFFSCGMGRVMLERIGDNVEYGYYSVGDQFSTYMNLVTTALFTAFNPDIYECSSNGNYKKLLKIFLALVSVQCATVFCFIGLAPFIISILTAGRYTMSVGYAQILSISQILILVFYFINDFSVALGKTKIILWTKIIVGILSIFILQFMINTFSYIGAAWGQSIIYVLYIVVNVVLLVIVRKKNQPINS